MITKEFLLYGLRKGETERWTEELLATELASAAAADKIKKLAERDGFHSFRIATFDGAPPDFTKVLAKGKRK